MNDKLLTLQNNKELILCKSLEKLSAISNLKIQFGFEIEFYLRGLSAEKNLPDDKFVKSFLELINERCGDIDIFDKIELEKGEVQCEIKTKPSHDVAFILDKLTQIDRQIEFCCKEKDLVAIYTPRPFLNDCANAFQVNFSLLDENGVNILSDGAKVAADIADFIAFHLDELFVFSNETDEDFIRYDAEYNKSIFKSGKFVAPTSKSWGYDNRSCAVRVLNKAADENNARIEIRTPSNNSDKCLLLGGIALILCEFFTAEDKYTPKRKNIYGNSFDDNYVQHKFPENYEESVNCFLKGSVFASMMELVT